jgi:RNA polymerase sigma-70 factor (ECF subfamily)
MTLGESFQPTMELARRGDRDAMAALYRDVQPQLLRFLRAREPVDGEDLASDVWLVLARKIPAFRGDEQRWLGLVFLVARRRLNDHWKQRARRRTDPAAGDDLADHPASADVEMDGIEKLTTERAVAFVLQHLTEKQADVVLLRVLAGLAIEEVARAVGMRPGHVRVVQHRALRRLAAALAPEAAAGPHGSPATEPHRGAAQMRMEAL